MRAERERKWMLTPKGKFSVQKRKAKQRGIPWELSFEQWWGIWEQSGKWDLRGDTSGMYCMSRREDTGPYSVTNVYINKFGENTKESYDRLGINACGRFNPKVIENLQ